LGISLKKPNKNKL